MRQRLSADSAKSAKARNGRHERRYSLGIQSRRSIVGIGGPCLSQPGMWRSGRVDPDRPFRRLAALRREFAQKTPLRGCAWAATTEAVLFNADSAPTRHTQLCRAEPEAGDLMPNKAEVKRSKPDAIHYRSRKLRCAHKFEVVVS